MVWTIILVLMIMADSIFTVFIGHELNPIILGAMNAFDMSLKEVISWRTGLLMPVVYIAHKYQASKIVSICYCSVYLLIVGIQIAIMWLE